MTFAAVFAIHAPVGTTINLALILEQMFSGSGIRDFYLFNGANDPTQGYWGNGSTDTRIFNNGTEVTGGFSTSTPANATMLVGNDIWSGIFVQVTASAGGRFAGTGFWLPIVPAVYVDPTPQQTTASDVVAAAYHLLASVDYTDSPNGCHTIATTIAAMAGAPLPDASGSIVPSQNVDGGLWTAVHRGDQTTVAEWTALLQPGDIVRYDYADPAQPQHTFVVLAVSGLLVRTIDNWNAHLNDHWTNFQQYADPAGVTIYRITEDMNTYWGHSYNDNFLGSARADRMLGRDGDDWLNAGQGHDELFGEAGADILDGGAGDDLLNGGAGHDQLAGGDGNDTLMAGGGNDSLTGGRGADLMIGNAGDDVFSLDSAADRVVEQAAGGTDRVTSAAISLDLGRYAHVEDAMLAGTRNLDLTGDHLANRLTGNAGNNRILGGAGDDVMLGGGGDDLLRGGLGRDIMAGGAGDDLFLFFTASEAGIGATSDHITDFVSGFDRIGLQNLIPGGSFIDAAPFTAAGQVRFDAATVTLAGDLDGDGRADFRIVLRDVSLVTAADILF